VPPERYHFLTGCCVPHFQGLVQAAANDPPPIRAVCYAPNSPSMPPKRERFLAICRVPYLEGFVPATA
jgi:hypothetical protein